MASLKPLEKDIQKAILDYLRLRGHFVWRQNTGGVPIHKPGHEGKFRPAPMKGVSDILGVCGDVRARSSIQCGSLPCKGKFIAIEVKRPGEYPTPAQQLFLQGVRERNGVAFVATSIDDCIRAGL